MATSGYYDEIAKVEALRRQQRWQFRRRHADPAATNATTTATRKRSRPRRPAPIN